MQDTGPRLTSIQPVTVQDVAKIIKSMPAKSSPQDVVHTPLLKSCSEVFAELIAHLEKFVIHWGSLSNKTQESTDNTIAKAQWRSQDFATGGA